MQIRCTVYRTMFLSQPFAFCCQMHCQDRMKLIQKKSCIEALAFTQSPYTPFKAGKHLQFYSQTKTPVAFHFWHVVCKNDPDNNFKRAQFKSGKIHTEMFLHSITFMLFTILSANTCHFFSCKLVRVYKTHTLEKKQSVFSSLLSDYKAYESYKTRFIT